ncbi:peptidase C14, caspase catalytic subunit p20 [Kutzneria sp. 744]|nr:peptidase C14, caspase catalytic subunit p20 [Kutzneria sp. 744]
MVGSVIGRAWRAFNRWRRSRPFWAGLFLLLSGLIILFPPFASLKLGSMAIAIQTIGGLSGALIGALLVVCALTMWLRPQFRLAAGVASLILSLTALITTNLGGFLLGTLFGLLGSALALSWTPKTRKRKAAKAVPPAAAAFVVLLGLTAHGVGQPSYAFADPTTSSVATSTTAASTTAGSTTTTTVAPTSTTSPSSSSSVTATSTTAATSTTTATPSPPALPAGTRVWTLESPSIAMSGLAYKGIVSTVVGGKTIKVLKFTASSVKIKNLVQTADRGGGHKIVTTAAPGSTSAITDGTITMLTAEIKGTAVINILGIPVRLPIDYTATSPPLITPPDVTFENVVVTNTDQSGGTLTIPGAKIVAT